MSFHEVHRLLLIYFGIPWSFSIKVEKLLTLI